MVRRVFEAYTRRFVASLILEEAIARPRRGRFIQKSRKLEYLSDLVVGTDLADHIESPVTSLWFVGYSKRSRDARSQFWFWMKQSQYQGAAILCNICSFKLPNSKKCLVPTGSNFVAIDCSCEKTRYVTKDLETYLVGGVVDRPGSFKNPYSNVKVPSQLLRLF
jgi:hypothetical protein